LLILRGNLFFGVEKNILLTKKLVAIFFLRTCNVGCMQIIFKILKIGLILCGHRLPAVVVVAAKKKSIKKCIQKTPGLSKLNFK
jgi:hypothetical protein